MVQTAERSHAFGGVFASTICPMIGDGEIDTDQLAAHLAFVSGTDGMRGLLVNGHAGENLALDRAESVLVIETAKAVCGDSLVVAGINCERTDIAAAMAADAARAGADAVMVFPPFSWALGADERLVVEHHRAVAQASGLPLFLFQGSVSAGKTAFSERVLARLLEIESVVGIKEGSWETAAYDATRRLSRQLRPDVAVMASGDEHLFPCFAIGSEGSLVSLAAVVPEMIVELDRAVIRGDLSTGRQIHDRLYRLGRTIYGAPGHLAALRIKTCLQILGRLQSVTSRIPIAVLDPAERAALADALDAAGVLNG
ncbi:dihydrodipicolinate synthase family protein [Phyllobacterium sp. 0TCS1.6C]|uniref:dihydrodipicolinate synthase family protein n=1 Tax=unclassified Phyllobacterium TaxID=2638441 RepID=UPI0022652FE8|nr:MULTISPECIES: dihydrodipicolinate synthase family protein [unclassified Phyllobacterium]MCX8281111.1 dihydrodipicolinate synthase family protein [Phyllobacterium sp. 0TCS1.6C]MCX8294602.1 dihydrodipicolinate synthase family protein [Phyllobacterium sp. 0TCS1.6A]